MDKDKKYPGRPEEDFIELECHKGSGESGWCGTCIHFANKSEPGYCGEGEATENDTARFEQERSRPSGWGGWGFCDQMCRELDFAG